MDLLSPEYGAFVVGIAALYWLIPQTQIRLLVVLTASLLFYTLLQKEYVSLLLFLMAVNFWLGSQMSQRGIIVQRLLLWGGILLDLGVLLGFKYVPFLASTASSLTGWAAGNSLALWMKAHIEPPLTLSFFVFELIAYLMDVYRGAKPAQGFQGFLNFSAYKLFFPKLISGPITRYGEFVGQLASRAKPRLADLAEGAWLIAFGAAKKGIVADNAGRYVDLCFRSLERASSADLWLALVAYAIQIYCDFSGYIDMARGVGLLFGFRLPQNFDFPYFATSITDFWRRWHMTLGAWMRSYLYIPLGGSRGGLFKTCQNLFIVMVVVGIWHGANWGFVVWGIFHGALLVLHRLVIAVGALYPWLAKIWQPFPLQCLAWGLTQALVLVSWVPFRLPELRDSLMFFQRCWGFTGDPQFGVKIYVTSLGLTAGQIGALLGTVFVMMAITYAANRARWELNWQTKLFLVPMALYLVGILGTDKKLPFIYFGF